MGKDAHKPVLSAEARQKFEEFVAAMAACGFGPDGPPLDTTFSEIEAFGHEVGQMVACAIDGNLTTKHAKHFGECAACPACNAMCDAKPQSTERHFQTIDGAVPLEEPVFHCLACRRDFFPSAYSTSD